MPAVIVTLAAILPIFALIVAGFAGRRLNIFGAASQIELARFVIKLALPVLLFKIVAEARPADIWQPGYIFAFSCGLAVTFAAAVALRWRLVGMADAIVDGLSAAFANTAFIGIPLCLALFGTPALLAPSIAVILTSCLLFALTILMIEMALRPGVSRLSLIAKALAATIRNPLVFAPIIGAVFCVGEIDMPGPLLRFVDLLAVSTSPCALVALGMFLAERRPPVSWGGVTLLTALKLVLQPAATYVVAYHIWPIDPYWAKLAVIVAALPTGTGPFMLAELYGREVDVAARTILLSTILSIATISALTLWL